MRWSTTNVTCGIEIYSALSGLRNVRFIRSRGDAPSSLAPGCHISRRWRSELILIIGGSTVHERNNPYFQLNVEAYPQSANVYDSLGEAYMVRGDKEKAMRITKEHSHSIQRWKARSKH
jgi:hypothetical protein